jgi:hypothetical protein
MAAGTMPFRAMCCGRQGTLRTIYTTILRSVPRRAGGPVDIANLGVQFHAVKVRAFICDRPRFCVLQKFPHGRSAQRSNVPGYCNTRQATYQSYFESTCIAVCSYFLQSIVTHVLKELSRRHMH